MTSRRSEHDGPPKRRSHLGLFSGSARPSARRSVTHGVSFAGASFVSSVVVALISSVVTARLYGAAILGQVALASAPVGVLGLLSTVREQPALVRLLAPLPPREERVTGLWVAVFAFSFGLTLAVAIPVAVVASIVLTGPVGQPELVAPAMFLLGGYIVLANTSWNLDSVFAAYGDGQNLFVLRLHEALMMLGVTAALSLHPTMWGPIVGVVAGWSTALIHRLFLVRAWMSFRPSGSAVRSGFGQLHEIIRFGLKMTPGSIASGLSTQAGVWTLGVVAPVAAVGAYSRAWSVSSRFVDVNWRLGEMVFPALVEREARGDRAGFDRVYVTALRYATTVLVALAAIGGGAATAVMAFFGPDFTAASTALALTLLVPLFATVATLQGCALLALGFPGSTSMVAIVSACITVVATVVLAEPLGVTGPALALSLGGVAGIVLSTRVVRRHVRPPFRLLWPYRQRALTLIAAVMAFAAARLASSLITGPLGLAPALGAGFLTFVLVFVGGGALMPEDRERLRAGVKALQRPLDQRQSTPSA
jgi:O-antigen/teichoic acid export membrane protein